MIQVAYREAITQAAIVDYTHKKQSGGSGQYAKIKIEFSPADDETEIAGRSKSNLKWSISLYC